MSRLKEELARLVKDYKELEDPNYVTGYVEGDLELKNLLLHHQMMSCAFATRSSNKAPTGTPRRIFLKHTIGGIQVNLDGVPFVVGASAYSQCHRGTFTHLPKRDEMKLQKLRFDHDYLPLNNIPEIDEVCHEESFDKKKARGERESKKVNCPAVLQWFEVICFPKHMVDLRSSKYFIHKEMSKVREEVNDIIAKGEFEKRFYVKLPLEGAHQNHSLVMEEPHAGLLEPVHPKVSAKIQEIVYYGIDRIAEVKLLLKQYIDYELLPEVGLLPDPQNRSFYPKTRDLQNHINMAKQRIRKLYGTYPVDLIITVEEEDNRVAEPAEVEPPQEEPEEATSASRLRDVLQELEQYTHQVKDERRIQECMKSASDMLKKLKRATTAADTGGRASGAKRKRQE